MRTTGRDPKVSLDGRIYTRRNHDNNHRDDDNDDNGSGGGGSSSGGGGGDYDGGDVERRTNYVHEGERG